MTLTSLRLTYPLQLSRAIQWLEKADFEAKIIIAGKSTPLSKRTSSDSTRKP